MHAVPDGCKEAFLPGMQEVEEQGGLKGGGDWKGWKGLEGLEGRLKEKTMKLVEIVGFGKITYC